MSAKSTASFNCKSLLVTLRDYPLEISILRRAGTALRDGIPKLSENSAPFVAKTAVDLLTVASASLPNHSTELKRLSMAIIEETASFQDEGLELRKFLLGVDLSEDVPSKLSFLLSGVKLLHSSKRQFKANECSRVTASFLAVMKCRAKETRREADENERALIHEMAGKLASGLSAWCRFSAREGQGNNYIQLAQKVGLFAVYHEWALQVSEEQAIKVLARSFVNLPLDEITESSLPANLVRLWASFNKKRGKWRFISTVILVNHPNEVLSARQLTGFDLLAQFEIDSYIKSNLLSACDLLLNELVNFYERLGRNVELSRALVLKAQVQRKLGKKENLKRAIENCSSSLAALSSLDKQVGLDEKATCHLWLAVYKYEQIIEDSMQQESRTVAKILNFEEECVSDDKGEETVCEHLKKALDLWKTPPQCYSIPSTAICLKTAAHLYSLFHQPVSAVQCCFIVLALVKEKPEHSGLACSALVLASSILRSHGEIERAQQLFQFARDQSIFPPDIKGDVKVAVNIEESRILISLGKVKEAECLLKPLLDDPLLEFQSSHQLHCIIHAQFYGVLVELLGKDDGEMDASLLEWLQKSMKLSALSPVDVLSECYHLWASVADFNDVGIGEENAGKSKRKVKASGRKERCLLAWTTLTETVHLIDSLSQLYVEQQLREKAEAILREGFILAGRFRLTEWRRRFAGRLARFAKLSGADDKHGDLTGDDDDDDGSPSEGTRIDGDEESPLLLSHRVEEMLWNDETDGKALDDLLDEIERNSRGFARQLDSIFPAGLRKGEGLITERKGRRKGNSKCKLKSRRRPDGSGDNALVQLSLAKVYQRLSGVALEEKRFDEAAVNAQEGLLALHEEAWWGDGEGRLSFRFALCSSHSSRLLTAKLILSLVVAKMADSGELESEKALQYLTLALGLLSGWYPVVLCCAVCQLLAFFFHSKDPLVSSLYLHQSLALSVSNHAMFRWGREIRNLAEMSESRRDSLIYQKNLMAHLWDDANHFQSRFSNSLPKGWVVCSISVLDLQCLGRTFLAVSRLEPGLQPIVHLTPIEDHEGDCQSDSCCCIGAIFKKYQAIFRKFKDLSRLTRQASRRLEKDQLETKLEDLCHDMEERWLGAWKCLCVGNVEEELDNVAKVICSKLKLSAEKRKSMEQYVKMVFNAWPFIEECHVKEIFGYVIGSKFADQLFVVVKKKAKAFWSSRESTTRKPVILILDKSTHMFPWESLDIMKDQTVSRMPSLGLLLTHLHQMKTTVANSQSAYYVLNPGKELRLLEKTYKDEFERMRGWVGIAGHPPTTQDLSYALSRHDLYLYFGHGNGSQYVPGSSIERLNCKALAVLMGCSSGTLKTRGSFEPSGIVYNYLLAGCPAFVGTLWDVTLTDVRHLSDALLKCLLRDDQVCLPDLINEVRNACPLRYLEGATPVCYGLPVLVGHT